MAQDLWTEALALAAELKNQQWIASICLLVRDHDRSWLPEQTQSFVQQVLDVLGKNNMSN